MEKFIFCALSITEMRGAIAYQGSEKKKKQHGVWIIFLHFQIFKTCGNLEIDFSITANNVSRQLSIRLKLHYFILKF